MGLGARQGKGSIGTGSGANLFLFLWLLSLSLTLLSLGVFLLAVLGRCSERRPLFLAMLGLLTVVSSLVTEHTGCSSCGSQAWLPCSMWILVSRPGIESVSPELAGGLSTTGPPGKF